jgi:hypothetical protein
MEHFPTLILTPQPTFLWAAPPFLAGVHSPLGSVLTPKMPRNAVRTPIVSHLLLGLPTCLFSSPPMRAGCTVHFILLDVIILQWGWAQWQWLRGLRSLERWNRGFESHSRHGCLCEFVLYLCCSVCRAALRRADLPSKLTAYRIK